jgi:hypothetical protein
VAGRHDEGLAAVDHALELAGPVDAFDRAPLQVLAADLLLAGGDAAASETRLRAAVVEAERIGARMIEVRALSRLVALGGPGGGDARALRQVLDGLTEGSGQPDVLEARAALGEPAATGA